MSQDLLPRGASAVLGGPLGRRAQERERSPRRLIPLIVAMTVLPMVIAVTRQGHCLATGWNGDEQFWRGCFSDLPAQYQIAHLDRGLTGWLDGAAGAGDQLPLLSGLMALVGGLVPGEGWLDETRWYVAIWAVVITALVATAVWCLGRLRPDRLDLATQLALSPALVVAALISPEMVVVALVLGAMLAWQGRRPVLTGVLLGVAVLGHVWVVGVVVALLLTAARRGGPDRAAMRVVGSVMATVVVLVGLLLLVQPSLVLEPVRGWWAQGAGYGAAAMIPQLFDHPAPVWVLNLLVFAGWGAALALATVFARRAWVAPTWAQVALVLLVVVLLTGKSLPVQAGLVVVALLLLGGARWPAHLGLVALEAVHATGLWLYIAGQSDPDKGLPAEWYAILLLARAIGWVFVVWHTWYLPGDDAARTAQLTGRPLAAAVEGGWPAEPSPLGVPAGAEEGSGDGPAGRPGAGGHEGVGEDGTIRPDEEPTANLGQSRVT